MPSKLAYISDAIENPVSSVMPQLFLFHINEFLLQEQLRLFLACVE